MEVPALPAVERPMDDPPCRAFRRMHRNSRESHAVRAQRSHDTESFLRRHIVHDTQQSLARSGHQAGLSPRWRRYWNHPAEVGPRCTWLDRSIILRRPMIFLPLRYRRALLVPAGLLVSSTPMHAQAVPSRENGDSVSLLPAIAVSAASTGASVAVLDSATIASSGARTLSELLLARVPGLSVRHRGGTEADGFEISSRGMGPAGYLAPLLIIDGVVASAQ